MKIAVACYPTYGGSGVIATELGIAMAARGHEVHFLSYEPPHRLALDEGFHPNVFFHEVQVTAYPLFRYPPYDLALASKMVEVAEAGGIDLIHAHYAIPHAISAVLAREMLGGRVKVMTTLHGTDVTVVGQDKSYLTATRYGITRSDMVTAVSNHLRDETLRVFCPGCDIRVLSNFVDTARYAPRECGETRAFFASRREKILMHVSNFRPVKRVEDVVRIFAAANRKVPCRLLLVGDGPELPRAEALAEELEVRDRVHSLGQRGAIEQVLPCADLFLLPSESESFGLAALEAMACGVPVIASSAGGLPEVVEDGVGGFLRPAGDVKGMSEAALRLLRDGALRRRIARAARARAVARFDRSKWVDAYEAAYRELLSR
ncbi:MAG: N-acetyl-alpha-D-glucosaminyl L-malate synthase BshA [Planctomycetaceae bacterium]